MSLGSFREGDENTDLESVHLICDCGDPYHFLNLFFTIDWEHWDLSELYTEVSQAA